MLSELPDAKVLRPAAPKTIQDRKTNSKKQCKGNAKLFKGIKTF